MSADQLPEPDGGSDGVVRGWMCLTSWTDEIGHASDGVRIFPSLAAIQRETRCWATCGVVEVELRCVAVPVAENLIACLDDPASRARQ